MNRKLACESARIGRCAERAGLLLALLLTIVAPVLGQSFSAWSPPVNLGPVVNSTANDACPFITKDGLSLYFRSTRAGGYGDFDIYVSQRASLTAPWGPPVNLGPRINTSSAEVCTYISNDGHWLYFISDRAGGCGGTDIYVSYRQDVRNDFAWEAPKNLGCTVNSAGGEVGPALFEDPATGKSVLYLSSDRAGGAGGQDIYVTPMIAPDSFGPISPVTELNSTSVDVQSFIRRHDGLEVIIVSSRAGGAGGTDLFVATRDSTAAPWSTPVNLGPILNTAAGETRPSISWDGTELYFWSDRMGAIGAGRDMDLYVSRREVQPSSGMPGGIAAAGPGTSAVYSTGNPASASPYPSDIFTVPDTAQKTGKRMNLPRPDCTAEPSLCSEIDLINEMDGFNINPRLQVRFPAPVDVNTLNAGIFIVWLNDLTAEEFGMKPAGSVTLLNQVLYDPATNTAYAKPDETLAQHRRYALVVTDAVRDTSGAPVLADAAFLACLSQKVGYCGELSAALAQVAPLLAPRKIAAASIFTTMSATAWLERARVALDRAPIGLEKSGTKSIFPMADLASMTVHFHTAVNPTKLTPMQFPLYLLNGVGRVAFGSFTSPRFYNEIPVTGTIHRQFIIPAAPTGRAVNLPESTERIQFHAYLPETPPPPGGYPVVIAPGNTGNNAQWHTLMFAGSFARHGLATIAINVVGAGNGPEGKVVLQEKSGKTYEIPLGGRGVDVDRNNAISDGEGCVMGALKPHPVMNRDCNRQTALDLQQLVRAIKAGIDLDGDGVYDLDRNRISYHGLSFGAMYGPVFVAVSPDVTEAVFESGGSPRTDIRRWVLGGDAMRDRRPPLLNKGNSFDEDYVMRYQPVKIVTVPGALAIQEYFERSEWIEMPGEAFAYAPHLFTSTLSGVPLKRVLFQMVKGDRVTPNLTETSLIRAANLRESTSYYRHDLAMKLFPTLNNAGHYSGIPNITMFGLKTDALAQYVIAMLVQEQAAGFLASGGTAIPDVNIMSNLWFGVPLFEVPPKALPEELNW